MQQLITATVFSVVVFLIHIAFFREISNYYQLIEIFFLFGTPTSPHSSVLFFPLLKHLTPCTLLNASCSACISATILVARRRSQPVSFATFNFHETSAFDRHAHRLVSFVLALPLFSLTAPHCCTAPRWSFPANNGAFSVHLRICAKSSCPLKLASTCSSTMSLNT